MTYLRNVRVSLKIGNLPIPRDYHKIFPCVHHALEALIGGYITDFQTQISSYEVVSVYLMLYHVIPRFKHPICFILLNISTWYIPLLQPPPIHNKVIIFLGTFGFSGPSSRPSCAQTNRAVTPSSLACRQGLGRLVDLVLNSTIEHCAIENLPLKSPWW